MIVGGEENVFEVFARFGDDQSQIRHVGSVRAANPTLAWYAGKEAFARRDEQCSLLWVAQRSSMVRSTSEDTEYLHSPARREYRLPGFPMRHKRSRQATTNAPSTGLGDKSMEEPN